MGLGSLMLTPRALRAQPSKRLASVDALTLDGSIKTLSASALTGLDEALSGPLFMPGEEEYETCRRLFFYPRSDAKPAFIARATGAADVSLAVNFARDNGLMMSVKGRGHSDLGVSSRDGAMMLDLGLIRGVRLDPSARRAWVAGATPTGLIDQQAGAHLLAVPLGGDPTVGIGGLALGGGIGKLGRTYGLTLDCIRSIEVVCADGQLRRASANEHSDLFWAMRGGGSNFGIATGFEFLLNPVPEHVVAGTIAFPFSELGQVTKAYGDFAQEAPDHLYVELLVTLRSDPDSSLVQLNACFIGKTGDAAGALQPLRQFGHALRDDISAVSYPAAQHAEAHSCARAPAAGAPRDTFFRSGFIDRLGAPLAAALAENLKPGPDLHITILFLHGGGAISRRPATSTAFSHRTMLHDMIFVATWPSGSAKHGEDAKQMWSRLQPFTTGFYVNEMAGGVSPSEVAGNYGVNAARLAITKLYWDPDNLFRLNANILPKARE